MPVIDIIIPVVNEARNVGPLCQRIHQALTAAGLRYRLIFVIDRSTDGTAEALASLALRYPIITHRKQGKIGKAYSILEGARLATTPYVVMIDGDLQYPPEAIPAMLRLTPKHGVVIAERAKRQGNWLRHFVSYFGELIVGKFISGFNVDVQSGLKVFRRDILEHINHQNIRAWALDVPLLHTARALGYSIGSVPITFAKRQGGRSKVHFITATFQIVSGALKTRLVQPRFYRLRPVAAGSMLGAGVAFRRQRFITHTTLPNHQSALVTFTGGQKALLAIGVSALGGGLFVHPYLTAVIVIGALSGIYFVDMLFNLLLVTRSLRKPAEIVLPAKALRALSDRTLPTYSILCPLYHEAAVLPQFVEAINRLRWPKDKLEVLLLLEADDTETIAAAGRLTLPDYFRVVIVPDSTPKTKPKACNYGLGLANGEYIVIYDAEDKPDPWQLKKAYLAFTRLPRTVGCLQAKLSYYNPQQNILTRLFSAEYALWFDLILPGLQSIAAAIPLGGTSNHFRTNDLRALRGWDPFNVTEDCDLGVRLFKAGFTTAIIDSTTWEEANSAPINWLRQRSRWIKGYMQTYLVHMRRPWRFVASHGWQALVFQLMVGGKIAFMLINPILWIATLAYFSLYAVVGPAIESVYPPIVFYLAATSLIFGNFLCLYYYLISCAKREEWWLLKYVYLVPFYWLMISAAAGLALWQLFTRPHYWEKTHHGLHLTTHSVLPAEELLYAKKQLANA